MVKQNSAQQGSIMIVAIVFIIVVMAAAAGISKLTFSSAMVSTERVDSERAFYAAESARLMKSDIDLNGDLFGRINPDGSDYPDCGSDDLYVGWMGDSWSDARARHAICVAGAGPWGDPEHEHWEDPDNAYNPEDISHQEFQDLALTEKHPGSPHVTVNGNLYVNAKVGGTAQWEVNGKACIGNDAELKGWPGQSAFNGNVYFESEDAIDAVETGGGPPGNEYSGCVYVAGGLDEGRSSNPENCAENIPHWCGIEGFDDDGSSGDSSWNYAGGN